MSVTVVELLFGLSAMVAFITLPVLGLIRLDEWRMNRRNIDTCMRRHPAWTDDTERAIEQALAVGDDGAALADEAERWLKERTR